MKFWQVLVTILVVAAIGVGIAVWQPWKTSNRKIDVSAEGKVKGVPDVMKITAGVEITKDTSQLAQTEASTVLDKVIKAAKDNGVVEKDIQTQNISTQPRYDYMSGNKITGYYGRGMATITVRKIDTAQAVLDAVSKAGANSVYGPQLTFSDEMLKSLEDQARTKAVINAKDKADKLATASGAKVGKVISMSEQNGGGQYYPMFATESVADLKSSAGGAVNSVSPGENEITISVNVSYTLK